MLTVLLMMTMRMIIVMREAQQHYNLTVRFVSMYCVMFYSVLHMYASVYFVHSNIFCFVWFVRTVTHIWMCEVNFMFDIMHQCFSASTA